MSEIDWKTELRKVERQFSGLPPEPSADDIRQWRIAEEREQQRREELNGAAGAWIRLSLVTMLAAGLSFWPYARTCGVGLYGFVGAEAAVTIGGVWVGWYSWRRRAGRAHGAAFLLTLVGAALLAMEVLPRVGYAMPDPSRPPAWSCT